VVYTTDGLKCMKFGDKPTAHVLHLLCRRDTSKHGISNDQYHCNVAKQYDH